MTRDLIAVAMPFVAALLQWVAWPLISPFVWFLFFPTVFLSTRLGSLAGGIVATVVSAVLVVYVFLPPQLSFAVANLNNLYSVGVFVGMGVVFALTHQRLKDATRSAARALAETRAANQELEAANVEITKLYEKSQEVDRLKTQLFSNVSHELRTPLALILGPVSNCLGDPDLGPRLKRELEVVFRNAHVLHRHVNDLLDVAKLEAGRMATHYSNVDLVHLVRFVESQFEMLAEERHIRLTIDAPPAVHAQVDGALIQRCVTNVLSNAFKFTPDGGSIRVSIAGNRREVRVVVDDSGPGVPADMREAIFESFRQLDGGISRARGGTGLGLAIVRHLVQLHRGSAWVEDGPDGGARLVLRLPAVAPEGVGVAAEPFTPDGEPGRVAAQELLPSKDVSPPGRPVGGAPLVLVVEDNADMRAFLAEVLEGHCRVATAADGAAGLKLAHELEPDLVITDVMMPGMSGDQLVEELRRSPAFDDVPIIVLTARADDHLQVEMLGKGVQDYLRKPFDAADLRARAIGLLRTRQRVRQESGRILARLNSHVDHSPLAVVEFDRAFRIVRWAGTAEQVFGWTANEVMGKRLDEWQWVHEDDAADVGRLSAEMVAGRTERTTHRNRNYRKDGTVITCEWYNSVLRGADGEIDSTLSLVLDVTERVNAEARLLELYEQARRDTEAKGRLLTEVNHRVKNNLLTIQGLLLFEKRTSGADTTPGLASSLDRLTRRIDGLASVHDLLSKSEWAPLPVADLCRRVVHGVFASARGEVALDISVCDAVVSPRQAGSLAFVLTEFATNTLKYARAGDAPLHVSVTPTAVDDTLLLEYRDDGPGYPTDVIAGERLSTGMSLARELVQGTLRGTLRLLNDGGAVARLNIPMEEPDRT